MVFNSIFGDFFSGFNFGSLGSTFSLASAFTNLIGGTAERNAQAKQAYFDAHELEIKAMEESYKYKMMANQIDLKALQDTKSYLAKTSASGLNFTGTVMDSIQQIQDVAYGEKVLNDRVMNNVVSSLERSAYNYKRAGKNSLKYGVVSDIFKSIGISALGFGLEQKKNG